MDKKISQLVAAGPLTGSELLPIVQSGVTKQTTLSDIQEAQSVTYAEAMSLIGTSSLVPGKTYLLSDFQTKHYIVDGNGNADISTIITGATEPLILTAASTSEFSPVASSTTFPQDIIHIDLDPNNWLFDLSFADVYGTEEIIPGFKGVITYREDTKNKNIFHFDFRNCKFRRWKINVPDWNSGTTYGTGQVIVFNNRLFLATNVSTNQTPSNLSNFWMLIVDLRLSRYLAWQPDFFQPGFVSIPVDANNYEDVKMFVENGTSGTYEASVFSNKFGNGLKDKDFLFDISGTVLPNVVIHLADSEYYNLYGNVFDGVIYANTITNANYFVQNVFLQQATFNLISGETTRSNTFSNSLDGSIISFNFQYNTFDGLVRICTLGYALIQNNILGEFTFNKIAGNSNNNTFESGFVQNNLYGSLTRNTFGVGASSNTIYSSLQSNMFGPYFRNNISTNVSSPIQNNVFGSDVAGLNFTSATHVYATYGCTISKKPDSTFALSYINNSNAQVIAAATA